MAVLREFRPRIGGLRSTEAFDAALADVQALLDAARYQCNTHPSSTNYRLHAAISRFPTDVTNDAEPLA